MSTADAVAGIGRGSRVVYVANDGVERNAIATDTPHYGYNGAVRLHSAFLNLVYLNDEGDTVVVAAAPLLGVAADDEHLAASAKDAVRKDVRTPGSGFEDKEALFEEHFTRLKANPRTIGWRPGSVGDGTPNCALTPAACSSDGSGSERWPSAEAWTDTAGAGLTADTAPVTNLPTQEQTAAIVAQADAEREQRKIEAEEAMANMGNDPLNPMTPLAPVPADPPAEGVS
jgi:hypothetical protein